MTNNNIIDQNYQIGNNIKNMTLTENYKSFTKKLCYLYENIETLEISDKNKVKNFIENILINEGLLEVNYKSKNEGRLFGKGGIQGIESVVRNFIFEDTQYKDIDMVSAVTNIMKLLCDYHDIESDELENYNTNRKQIIEEYYGGNKQDCKDFINHNFFNTVKEDFKPKNNFEKKMIKQIKLIQDELFEIKEFEDIKSTCIEKQKSENKTNFKGAVLCAIYHNQENMMLNKAVSYYRQQKNKNPFALFFDGFIVDDIDDKFLKCLNDIMEVPFVYKDFKQLAIPAIPDDFVYDINHIKSIFYIELLKKNKISFDDNTDAKIAETCFLLFQHNYVAQDNKIYVYHMDKWRITNEHLISYTMCNSLTKVYRYLVIYYNKEIMKQENNKDIIQSKIDALNKLIKKLSMTSSSKSILDKFKGLLISRCDNVEFDVSHPEVLAFENIAFNVFTGAEYVIKKSDYITHNTGYDYEKPTKKLINKVDDLFKSVFPDEDIRKCYLSVLKSGMTGYRQEKFIMCEGKGRNGKGMLNELFMMMLGEDYAYSGHISALTRPIKDGANPELASLHLKRFVKFEEPNASDKILLGNIKKLTGEGFLNARACHSNAVKQRLALTLAFECNAKPNIDGEVGDADIERFMLVWFMRLFTNDEEELKNNPNARPQNQELKTLEFQQNLRCALFYYILKNGNNKIINPTCVKERSRKYLLDNDMLFSFFTETYERDETAQPITVKEVMKEFKQSDLYINVLTKAQRRKHTEASLKNSIENHVELRKDFKDRYKQRSSVLLNWRLKPKEDPPKEVLFISDDEM